MQRAKVTFLILLSLFTKFFFVNCKSSEPIEKNQKFSIPERLVYYRESSIPDENEFFTPESRRFTCLKIRKQNSILIGEELEISVYVYRDNFLQKIHSTFPASTLKKVKIRENIKSGRVYIHKKPPGFEINFFEYRTRSVSSNELQEAIRKFETSVFEPVLSIAEVIIFSRHGENSLWKEMEYRHEGEERELFWRNIYKSPSVPFSFTQFIQIGEKPRYYRIEDEKEYLFHSVAFSDSGLEVYKQGTYVVYYNLNKGEKGGKKGYPLILLKKM